MLETVPGRPQGPLGLLHGVLQLAHLLLGQATLSLGIVIVLSCSGRIVLNKTIFHFLLLLPDHLQTSSFLLVEIQLILQVTPRVMNYY